MVAVGLLVASCSTTSMLVDSSGRPLRTTANGELVVHAVLISDDGQAIGVTGDQRVRVDTGQARPVPSCNQCFGPRRWTAGTSNFPLVDGACRIVTLDTTANGRVHDCSTGRGAGVGPWDGAPLCASLNSPNQPTVVTMSWCQREGTASGADGGQQAEPPTTE